MGFINNNEKIKDLENALNRFVIKGDSDSCLTFINTKKTFKESKVRHLTQIKNRLEKESDLVNVSQIAHTFFYGHPLKINEEKKEAVKSECIALIQEEIKRQQEKIETLNSCIPQF